MEIKKNIDVILNYLSGTQCRLVAVSKTKPESLILAAYEGGLRVFGENKAQEMANKHAALPKDIEWHMIGHLQRNKVKYIAPFVSLIHSVDSERLLAEVNKQGEKIGRAIPCLLQVHIAQEEAKHGFTEEGLLALLQSPTCQAMGHVAIKGLMGMATNTPDQDQVKQEFAYLKALFDRLAGMPLGERVAMEELSMGMSGDYPLAVAAGSTMVRVGSAIFGPRH